MKIRITANKLMMVLLVIFGLLVLIPFILYIIKFRHNGLSDKPEDWHSFFGFYISLLGLLLSGIIAKLVNDINIKANQSAKQFDSYKDMTDAMIKFSIYKFQNCSYQEAYETIRDNRHEFKHLMRKYGFLFNDYQKYYSDLVNALTKFENYCRNIDEESKSLSVSLDETYMKNLVLIKKCLNRLTKALQKNIS
jgi:hypothetical protein